MVDLQTYSPLQWRATVPPVASRNVTHPSVLSFVALHFNNNSDAWFSSRGPSNISNTSSFLNSRICFEDSPLRSRNIPLDEHHTNGFSTSLRNTAPWLPAMAIHPATP